MASRSRRAALAAGVVAILGAGVGPGGADEPDASRDGALVTRVVSVDALTLGLRSFLPPAVGWLPPSWAVADAEQPLFGAEGEEPVLPAGTAEEIAAELKEEVAPSSWEEISGADIRAQGSRLVVRSRPDVVEAVGRYLAALEARVLRPVTVEVQAVRAGGDTDPATLEEPAARALFSGDRAGPRVAVAGMSGQRFHAFGGAQVAYVGDYDTEVAQSAKVADPIVHVVSAGMLVSARPLVGAKPGSVLVSLEVGLSDLEELAPSAAVERGTMELPRLEGAHVRAVVDLGPDAWRRIDGAAGPAAHGGWVLYARAQAREPAGPPASAPGTEFPRLDAGGSGRFEVRSFDVGLLGHVVDHRLGHVTDLVPSNFTPTELPELAEPLPALEPEALVGLVRELVAPSLWDRGGSAELRGTWLRVRAPVAVLDAVAAVIGACRREFLWAADVRGEAVEVAEEDARALLAGGRHLAAEARQTLDRRIAEGKAVRSADARVSCRQGARNAVDAGTWQAYLQDYDAEIAEAATIGNPIVQQVLEGVTLDVWPATGVVGDAVLAEVRLSIQGLDRPLRTVDTPHGPITAPRMRVQRVRTTDLLPVGRTTVVAWTGEGARRTLFLLTPTLAREE